MNKNITFTIKNIPEKKAKVEEIYLFQKEKYFPDIDKSCKLHKKKHRIIKVADLESRTYKIYHIGQYKYYDDITNRWHYITEDIPNVAGKRRHNNSTILKAVEPVLRNEMTIQYASKQAKGLLNLTAVPSTIWRWTDIVDVDEKSYKDMEAKVIENISGHLSVDEVYDNGDGIIIITDPVKDTILSEHLLDGKPTDEDIIAEFSKLKVKGINPKSCTRDGSPLYKNTIDKIFLSILLQICIFHFIKNCLKYFLDWHRKIRDELKTGNLKRGLKGSGRSLKKYLFKTRCLFVKRNLTEKEKKKLYEIIDAIPEFGKLRKLFVKFISIFDSDNIKQCEKRFWDFLAEPCVGDKLPGVEKQLLKYYNQNELLTYLLFDETIRKKIRTSNHTERVNRKFRKKQKTHYRIRKTQRREKMLRLMVYFYNMKALGYDGFLYSFLFFLLYRRLIILHSDKNLSTFQRLRIFLYNFKKNKRYFS